MSGKGACGVLAQFRTPEALVSAARFMRERGYRGLHAYSPFPVEGLTEALGYPRSRIPLIALLAGILGGAIGYGLQYYSAVIDYPINVGGRPLHSWPAFMPVTFELTVLFAAIAIFIGVFALSRLPRYHHPLFGCPMFDHASRNRFFLYVESVDGPFDPEEAERELHRCGAERLEVLQP